MHVCVCVCVCVFSPGSLECLECCSTNHTTNGWNNRCCQGYHYWIFYHHVQPELSVSQLLLLLFSHSVVSDSFATPLTVAHQTPLSLGFSRQEYWNGLLFPSPGIFPIQQLNLNVSCISRQILNCWATWEATIIHILSYITY